MSTYRNSEDDGVFPQPRALPLRATTSRIVGLIQKLWARWQQRQELLEYVASDYRAAADIGITSGEARGWSQRPFWRV